MVAATAKRNTGTQSRTAYLRLFALIDDALASDAGLSTSAFCKDHGCSFETIRRYLFDLFEIGIRIGQTDGVWRYDEAQEPLFTPTGRRLFASN